MYLIIPKIASTEGKGEKKLREEAYPPLYQFQERGRKKRGKGYPPESPLLLPPLGEGEEKKREAFACSSQQEGGGGGAGKNPPFSRHLAIPAQGGNGKVPALSDLHGEGERKPVDSRSRKPLFLEEKRERTFEPLSL